MTRSKQLWKTSRLTRYGGRLDANTAMDFLGARPGASKKYDLIVANILAKPLVVLAPHSSNFLRSGGHIVLSGLLRTQRERF